MSVGDRHKVAHRSVRLPADVEARVRAAEEAGVKFNRLVVDALRAYEELPPGLPPAEPEPERQVRAGRRVFAMPGPAREPAVQCGTRVPAGAWCKSCQRIH